MSVKNGKFALFLLSLYFLPLLFLVVLALVSLQLDIPIAVFTRDPAVTGKISPLSGIASHLGVLLLTASGAVCLFSVAILRSSLHKSRFSIFLLCSGLMSLLLALDDLFMLHENIYPRLFHINEEFILLTYCLLVISGAIRFRKTIVQTEYLILLVGLGFLGLSLIVDGFQDSIEEVIGQWRILFEDGFKLLGIVGWFGYFMKCCGIATIQKNT